MTGAQVLLTIDGGAVDPAELEARLVEDATAFVNAGKATGAAVNVQPTGEAWQRLGSVQRRARRDRDGEALGRSLD